MNRPVKRIAVQARWVSAAVSVAFLTQAVVAQTNIFLRAIPTINRVIDRVDPPRGHIGEQITVNVYGRSFPTNWRIVIDNFVESNSYVAPGHLQAVVRIPDTARTGFRDVLVSPPTAFRLPLIARPPRPLIKTNAFEVLEPVSPDLIVFDPGYTQDSDTLRITASVANLGNRASQPAQLLAEAPGWAGKMDLPRLEAGRTNRLTIAIEIPDAQRGSTNEFVLRAEPPNSSPRSVLSHQAKLEIIIAAKPIPTPLTPTSSRFSKYWWVAMAALAVPALAIPHLRKVKLRSVWEPKAKEEEPRLPCQECQRYCRKRRVETEAKVTLSLYQFMEIWIVPGRAADGHSAGKIELDPPAAMTLNQAVAAARLATSDEHLRGFISPVSQEVLRALHEALKARGNVQDFALFAKLKGNEIEFEFTLYRCRKNGTANAWEKEDSWTASVEDERETLLATLSAVSAKELNTAPQARATEVSTKLLQFIKGV